MFENRISQAEPCSVNLFRYGKVQELSGDRLQDLGPTRVRRLISADWLYGTLFELARTKTV